MKPLGNAGDHASQNAEVPADILAEGDHLPGLFPHHLRELRASGLNDATIKAAGIKSEANYDKLAALLGWRSLPKRMAPAIVYPFTTAEGTNGYARIKPDCPRVVKGKPVKYESPKGQGNQVYLPPGVAHVLADATRELLVTEGEKKSLKATQDGFPCVGLVGVYGWKDGKSERLLPALERVKWQGRDVRIVFDSDAAANEHVRDAEARLAKHVTDRGAKVRVVRLPDGPPGEDGKPAKVGLDDYLVAHGPGPLRKLLDEAGEPEPVGAVEMKERASELDPATEAGAFLATGELDGVFKLRYWRGTFWYWTRGRYAEIATSEARGRLIRHLNLSYNQLTTTITNNVLDQLKAQSGLAGSIEPPAWLDESLLAWNPVEMLAARNGLIHLPSLVSGGDHLTRATPRFFTTSALDYDFSTDAPCPATWLAFLNQLWPGDRQSLETLQEWFGYCLTVDTRQQKILLLIGPKRSGKGTIARVLTALVGRENVAGPTLSSLATNFGLWPLLGKSVAIISDARLSGRADQAVVVERLLSISGEDSLTIDRKNLEPVTCRLAARFTILSNELPRLGDSSGALAGRMVLLRLTESFYGREDHDLTGRLLVELPGILLWAIEGWRRLWERGRFIQPEAAGEMLVDLEDLSSPVGMFLRECCQIGPGNRVAVDDLFHAWQSWCERKGRKEPGNAPTFGRDLSAALPTLKRTQPRDGEERYRAYEGIGLRPEL